MNDSWINIGYCNCTDTCERWGMNEDGSGGFFCPYVPENVESDTNKCKKLHHDLGKDIKPTLIMMDNLVEKLRKYAINQHGWIDIDDTCEAAADEIERLRSELILVKAERDGLASVLEDVRADYLRERGLVDGLTQAILDHLGASLEYNRN